MSLEHERLRERVQQLKGERDTAKSAYVLRMELHEAATKSAEAEIAKLRGAWGNATHAFEQAEKSLVKFESKDFKPRQNIELGT